MPFGRGQAPNLVVKDELQRDDFEPLDVEFHLRAEDKESSKAGSGTATRLLHRLIEVSGFVDRCRVFSFAVIASQ